MNSSDIILRRRTHPKPLPPFLPLYLQLNTTAALQQDAFTAKSASMHQNGVLSVLMFGMYIADAGKQRQMSSG